MKLSLTSALCACFFGALLARGTVCRAADAAAAAVVVPDYPAVINQMFDQAAACKIHGMQQEYRIHEINMTTPDAQALQTLRELFLREKPRYLGSEMPSKYDMRHPFGLRFTLVDKQGKTTGWMQLLEWDKLVCNGQMLFTTSADDKAQNAALMLSVADFACPALAAERKLPKPDYKAMIRDIFAKAASCKIKGELIDAPTTHKVDFSTSDAEDLKQLKIYFLRENPRFLVNSKDRIKDSFNNLYFAWFDARGKMLSRVSMLGNETVIFENTDDKFTTSTSDYHNVTLFTFTGRFALPHIYPRPPLASEEETE